MSLVTVVVAEKPSVARDLARVLKADKKCAGWWEGEGFRVTWSLGHLVRLKDPHELRPEWKAWRLSDLPIIPEPWSLEVIRGTAKQFHTVKKLLNAPETKGIVCATDAGREGEHIFRLIMEKSGCRRTFKRLWISSLTPAAIKEGMKNLRQSREFDNLADSARARSQADWLTGINLSRLYSLKLGETFSIGRVQTPALEMVVRREEEILNFTPEPFCEVMAVFTSAGRPEGQVRISADRAGSEKEFEGWYLPDYREGSVPKDLLNARRMKCGPEETKAIISRLKACVAYIVSVSKNPFSQPPPGLYDLTELQRHANRLYGFSANQTLETAQALYEEKKIITYPRTDSRFLSGNEAALLPGIVEAIKKPYLLLLAEGTGEKPLGKRWINPEEVREHHAIIPTGKPPASLSPAQAKIYDLICRRLLEAWHLPYESETTTLLIRVQTNPVDGGGSQAPDFYYAQGTVVTRKGWKVLEEDLPASDSGKKTPALPSGLSEGKQVWPVSCFCRKSMTRPPPALSEAALLTGMVSAGNQLDDRELSAAMEGRGLGTPATRAGIIETLKERGYVKKVKNALRATEKGIYIIRQVHPDIKSPRLTGEWEALLSRISQGQYSLQEFMDRAISHLRQQTDLAKSADKPQLPSGQETMEAPAPAQPELPKAADLEKVLQERFGLSNFRRKQKEVCESLIRGENCLVVMPTGAGKSLCYQLPAVVKQTSALVISPLIALMEDQVESIRNKGMTAGCIHGGKSREECREILRAYQSRQLRFLFVSPERLGVPGFCLWLARNPPGIIAIDEAHCISQWGHDFRADYRQLRERLSPLQDVPKIAMTATATARVREDIIRQLDLRDCRTHTAGFRRDNIRIDVVELATSERLSAAMAFLAAPENRPAIIYAPTRNETERCAAVLQKVFPARAYHAGMAPELRQKTQSSFMAGKTEVVVATVAFGMGIDKENIRTVVHLSLPSALSGYYQEIGRAGRDGKASRAILFYADSDNRTLTHLHNRSYPDLLLLKQALGLIGEGKIREDFLDQCPEDQGEMILQKLLVHGAVRTGPDARILLPAEKGWESRYLQQKNLREQEIQSVWDFAHRQTICRMQSLVSYFGDSKEDNPPCGACDVCTPEKSNLMLYRSPTKSEIRCLNSLWEKSKQRNFWPKGSLCQQIAAETGVKKADFEMLLTTLIRAGYLETGWAEFKKGSRTIRYQQVSLPHASLRKKPRPHWNDLKISEFRL